MPKRTTAIAAVVVLLFALTGCGEETATPADEPKPFAAPLTATEAPDTPEATTPDEIEAEYLERLRTALEGSGGNSIPDATDQQLIDAGHEACEQMSAGIALSDVRVVENEPESPTGYKDSIRIAAVAAVYFCSEFDPGG